MRVGRGFALGMLVAACSDPSQTRPIEPPPLSGPGGGDQVGAGGGGGAVGQGGGPSGSGGSTTWSDEDPASFLMVNCNNAGEPDKPSRRNLALARINFAADHGLGWARVSGGPQQWHTGGLPTPERFQVVLDHAHARGVKAYLFLEYRPDLDGGTVYDFDWFDVGRQFALAHGDRIDAYGVLNEVDHNEAVQGGLTPAHVAHAVSNFSDGVRSVVADAVIASPSVGGTPMTPGQEIPFLQALAPLIDQGRVDILNLHTYIDARSPCNGGPHWSSYDGSGDYAAPHENFAWHKRDAGIQTDVKLGAGEFNYREWVVDGCPEWGSWSRRGIGFLTTLWSELMAVHDDGKHASSFHGPFDIFRAEPQRPFSMALSFDASDPDAYVWTPNPLGETFMRALEISRGMGFVALDPHETSSAVLRGDGRKLWVWHNRTGFSTLAGAATVRLTGVPTSVDRIDVYTWETPLGSPALVVPTGGQVSVEMDAASLPAEQTLMLVAASEDDGGITGGLEVATLR
ncbi:MAG: hypothetical protein AAF928_05410 [Myxococcota bacterium]